jgi:hypothetical protein
MVSPDTAFTSETFENKCAWCRAESRPANKRSKVK